MLAIRLQRVGRKNDPSFRVILVDSKRAARTGSVLEVLGNYDARKGAPALNTERIVHWLSVGALPSGTVHNLLISERIIEGKKVNVLPKKSPPKKEEEESTEPADAQALAGEGSSEETKETESETPVEKSTEETMA